VRFGKPRHLEELGEALRAPQRIGALEQLEQGLSAGDTRGSERHPVAASSKRELTHLVRRPQPLAQRVHLVLLERPCEQREAHRDGAAERWRSGFEFGHQLLKKAAALQHVEHELGVRLGQPARELLPDALGHQVVGLARSHHLFHEFKSLVRDAKAEPRGESRHAQDAHGIFGEGFAHVAQYARLEVGFASEGIDQRPILGLGHGVDRQIPALEVLFEGHFGRGVYLEALVAAPALPLGAREGVFLVRFGMEEHGEVLAHGLEAVAHHVLGRGADHDVVPVLDGKAEQLVANRAADAIELHRDA
jgi:hypothetical protein